MIFLLIILSIPFVFIVGFSAPIIALPFSIWFARSVKNLKGVINYNKFEVDIYKKDMFYKKLVLKK